MPSPHSGRATKLALALATFAVAAPAAAQAATVTVTGDDGNPIALNAGAPTIRNMKPDVGTAFPPGAGRHGVAITDPAGNSVSSSIACIGNTYTSPDRVNYVGNTTYTVTVTNYGGDDSSCTKPLSTERYTFAIAASTAVQPAGPVLLREPGSFVTAPVNVQTALNPGADGYQLHVARNGVVGPTGDITGAFDTRTAGTDGAANLGVTGPGVYTVVARATRYGSTGEVYSPWSAPVQVIAKAPFDFKPGIDFLDRRGPSYRIRASLREATARGRVSIALARGTKGGKFRSIGTATISSKGTITKRFTARKVGNYRLRFKYKGSTTIAPGSGTIAITVRRTFSFG